MLSFLRIGAVEIIIIIIIIFKPTHILLHRTSECFWYSSAIDFHLPQCWAMDLFQLKTTLLPLE